MVGYAETDKGSSHAVLFGTNGGQNVDLGTLGGATSKAYGVNDAGQIVGDSTTASSATHGFVYTQATGMVDLNTLIAPSSGWEITEARAINAAGQIAASGTNGGFTYALLLTPTSAPTPTPSPTPTPRHTFRARPGAGDRCEKEDHHDKVFDDRSRHDFRIGDVRDLSCRQEGPFQECRDRRRNMEIQSETQAGKNKISVISHGPGGDSAPLNVTVIRK